MCSDSVGITVETQQMIVIILKVPNIAKNVLYFEIKNIGFFWIFKGVITIDLQAFSPGHASIL